MKIKVPFLENEYYHIYNRGVDKRVIFDDSSDLLRFYQSLREFNSVEPIGSLFKNHFRKDNILRCSTPQSDKLVKIVVYCLNPNHYHLILTPFIEGGISEFMRRLNGGYTNYYNLKNKRNGSLFQGTFKSVHIDSDSYLRFLSVYVNLNFRVHKKFEKELLKDKKGKGKKLYFKSSWNEYINTEIIEGERGEENHVKNNIDDICDKKMILSHFNSVEDYKKFAEETLKNIREKRYKYNDALKKDFVTNEGFLITEV